MDIFKAVEQPEVTPVLTAETVANVVEDLLTRVEDLQEQKQNSDQIAPAQRAPEQQVITSSMTKDISPLALPPAANSTAPADIVASMPWKNGQSGINHFNHLRSALKRKLRLTKTCYSVAADENLEDFFEGLANENAEKLNSEKVKGY